MTDKPDHLSEEDRKIWRAYIKNVNPLDENLDHTQDGPCSAPLETLPHESVITTPREPTLPHCTRPKRKRRYEASLDLHGLYQDEAYERLHRFIERQFQAQKKYLLIITGKGDYDLDRRTYSGVLYRKVPQWLGSLDLRSYIQSYSYASPNNGGPGALNVVLRQGKTPKSF